MNSRPLQYLILTTDFSCGNNQFKNLLSIWWNKIMTFFLNNKMTFLFGLKLFSFQQSVYNETIYKQQAYLLIHLIDDTLGPILNIY